MSISSLNYSRVRLVKDEWMKVIDDIGDAQIPHFIKSPHDLLFYLSIWKYNLDGWFGSKFMKFGLHCVAVV